MDIIISNADSRPIYEQISTQIKDKIIKGELKPGEGLPSMRYLAKELRISVITTKRAYEELERDGFIVTMTGKGSFVAEKNTDFIKEEYRRQIEEHMRRIAGLSASCNLDIRELREMLTLIFEEEQQ
ncbi:MAG: GntR family transcriptional regulator [Bacillota bacterium]|nr:GntR family transcriptional regulator [Bacillota bacterium]